MRAYLTPAHKRHGPVYHTDPDCPNLPDDHTEVDIPGDNAMDECGRCSGEMEQNGGPDTLYHELVAMGEEGGAP